MKRIVGIIGFVCIVFIQPLIAAITVQTKAREVTLFSSGAMIKRIATVTLREGTSEYIIYGLSPYLKEESLQIELVPKEVEIVQLKLLDTYLKEPFERIRQELKKSLENIEEEITKKMASVKSIETILKVITKSNNLCKNSFNQCLRKIEPLVNSYYAEIARLKLELKKLKKERSKIQKQLQQSKEPQKTKALKLLISSTRRLENAKIILSYYVTNATWKPYYQIRIDTDNSHMRLQYLAQLQQNTGEDWQDVTVKLSTAKPHIGATLPEPKPWVIDLYSPPPVFRKGPIKTTIAPAMAKPKIETGLITFNIRIPHRITLLSGTEKQRSILITQKMVSINLTYRTFPRASEKVFLEGKFKNPFNIPLLPGSIDVYVDGILTNRTYLSRPVLQGAALDIALGSDPSISVKRTLKKKYTETTGIFSKNKKVRYEYEISLYNGKSKPVELVLQDTLPVSANEKISVQILRPTREEAKITKDAIVTWSISLKPYEQKKVPVIFVVSYPEDATVVGLP